jgi:hypothetical protein
MKHILDCPEIEKEYLVFSLAPFQNRDRMIDLANVWIMGFERAFEKLIIQPSQEFLEQHAESDAEWFYLHLMRDGTESRADYGQIFDMRLFEHMKQLRKILEDTAK